MIERLLFGAVSTVLVFTALMAVTTRNLVHAVLWLGMTLATTAMLYILLQAPFLATLQLILYTGGVLSLMLFGVMLTRRSSEQDGVMVGNESNGRRRALPIVAIMLGLLVTAVGRTPLANAPVSPSPTTAEIGKRILSTHLLAFELLSVLLLAAMVGAIVLARRKDASLEGTNDPRERAAALPGSRPAGAPKEV
jgi:NADH-quinone oxidoreductase subunit J